MRDWVVWVVLFAIGLGTFALRLSFIQLLDGVAVPAAIRRGLRFVPPAVLAALVAPAIAVGTTEAGTSAAPARLLAGLVALGVAWWRRSVVWTLVAGMVTLLLVELATGH